MAGPLENLRQLLDYFQQRGIGAELEQDPQSFSYPVGSKTFDQALGFEARAVMVNNLTNQYLRLPDAGLTLRPGASQWVKLRGRTLRAAYVTPAGYQASPLIAGQAAELIAYATDSGGGSVPGAVETISSQTLLYDAKGDAGNSGPLPVPPGTHAIGVVHNDAGTSPFLHLVGGTTGKDYVGRQPNIVADQTGLTVSSIDIYPFASNLDQTVEVRWSNAQAVHEFWVFAVTDVQYMMVGTVYGMNLPVATVKQFSGSADLVDVSDRLARVLGVADLSDRAARQLGQLNGKAMWDAFGSLAPAAGSAATVTLGAVAGKRYVIDAYTLALIQNGATASVVIGQLKDGATVIWNEDLGVIATVGDHRRAGLDDIALPGTVGNSVSITVGPSATTLASVAIGAYLR